MTILHEGKFLRLVDDNGWEYAQRVKACRAVAIIAITPENKLVLVQQHRTPVGKDVMELPAGLIGDTCEESTIDAAHRELEEETGYKAKQIEFVTEGPTSPGMSSEVLQIVLATNLEKVGKGGGVDDENITVHEVELVFLHIFLEESRAKGILVDPKVYTGAFFALLAIRTGVK